MSSSNTTSTRPVFLLKFRGNDNQRHHLAAFIPNEKYAGVNLEDNVIRSCTKCKGHLIHIIGMPMSGYAVEFVSNFSTLESRTLKAAPKIGDVATNLIVDPPADDVEDRVSRSTPTVGDVLEKLAMSLPAPRAFKNLLGPVDDVNNRDCQSWLGDFIALVVKHGYLPNTAFAKVKAERDPGDLGTKLKKVEPNTTATATGERSKNTPSRATPSPNNAATARPTAPATSTSRSSKLGWHQEPGTQKWRKWDANGKKWIYR
ncbi:hypothetical protein KVR01_007552 [Diaporthe batatas]|uniref:uncharacterized protein n=1 Tax=Diaporthe batatas TaxID=748121 RepID=UPI001D04E79E|nr:uncharacterized protein KVR01_007552 [Diaporthe batatas]KAG8163074.1 hypothetical protein KVR01_007552 [Diaporthe batatas]